MKNFKYEDIKNNNYNIIKKLTISLTEEYSHEVIIQTGQGSFSIGVKGIDNECDVDAWVDKNSKINWNAFNNCEEIFKPLISPSIKWPRFFSYTGNDIGFIEWSKTRNIESFTWKPQKEINADFSNANIHNLYIESNYKINLSFGNNVDYLDLYGNPNNYIIEKCLKTPSLGFYLKNDNTIKLFSLPKYECFKNAEELLIEVEPNGEPFDCNSLLQFPNLKLLHLIGNMKNLSSLKNLKHLNKLGFWNVPELSDLPSLNNWNELDKIVAMNIDKNTGIRLKNELKGLQKQRKFDFVSISKLRNKLWFETEFGLPFTSWDTSKEKKANLIYKKCLKELKSSTTKNDIKNAIIKFTNSFNKMDSIETVERDDIYRGLCQLMKNSPINIEQNTWLEWFDEVRNF